MKPFLTLLFLCLIPISAYAECEVETTETHIQVIQDILDVNPRIKLYYADMLDTIDMECVCDWLFVLDCTGKVYLRGPTIQSYYMDSIPPSVGKLKDLVDIKIDNKGGFMGYTYNINNGGISVIPIEVFGLEKLSRLMIINQKVEVLPPEVGQLKDLSWLVVYKNRLSELPEELYTLPNIEWLNVSANNISEISGSIGKMTTIETLAIGNNLLTELPDEIGDIENLETFGIRDNLIESIPPSFVNLKKLRLLSIKNNKLTFEDFEPIMNFSKQLEKFTYSPQDSIHSQLYVYLKPNESTIIGSWCGGSKNKYQWYKDGEPIINDGLVPHVYSIYNNTDNPPYGKYTCAVTNELVPDLTIWRKTVHVLPEPSIKIKAKALLEGVFDTSTYLMENTLYQKELLPTYQPFNQAPWLYEGEECVGDYENIPDNILDWILMEVRDMYCPEEVIEQRAGFITTTGDIVGMDYQKGIDFYELSQTGYYISIKTRTHLAVMTKKAHKVPNELAIDFSDPVTIKGGTSQLADLDRGFYALLAGDFNSDGVISVDDFIEYKDQAAILNEYIDSDCNLDATVTVSDYNLYLPNVSKIGVMEIRYE